ncbi:MAG TPA: ABC transporter ATP-binding protein [Spirochaetota bacterium]|mgnify:CR=1 FL=1|nr:ABC transporter ATP-binding protein [Spirochaetota bacterium]
MKEPVFLVDSLSAGYGGKTVINTVSFGVGRGEFITLIGPNGAGKSTIIKAISGSLPAYSGRVLFLGRNLAEFRKKELASEMSVVNPVNGEIPDFSVKMFLSFGRFPFRKLFSFDNMEDDAVIGEMASRCGIVHLLERSIRELSAGEFQLVQVCRALIQNREVLLLDEPVSNLDYRHMIQVMDILSALNKTGSTIICALHDVNTAAEYSSRIIAFKNGVINFDGNPEKVISEEALSGLYDSRFFCGKNPVTGRPSVYPVPGSLV